MWANSEMMGTADNIVLTLRDLRPSVRLEAKKPGSGISRTHPTFVGRREYTKRYQKSLQECKMNETQKLHQNLFRK